MTTSAWIGLCGCAQIHTGDAIAALGGRGDLVCPAVWDPDPARATRAASQLGAEVAGSAAAADAVALATRIDATGVGLGLRAPEFGTPLGELIE